MTHTDIAHDCWIERTPARIRPYLYLMRLDRPIGTWLLFWPCVWSIILACNGNILTALPFIVAFGIGSIVMRGAGCVINDLWDRDLDGSVERTATRPIPNGDVTPMQALIFLGILLLLGLGILIQFNTATVITGIVSVCFVVTYPLMKRITWWPQAFLGLTFNFGALMGWAAVTGDLSSSIPWMIYIAGIFWTLGYDTIYAFQDMRDDALIGIKSSARFLVERCGRWVKPILWLFYTAHIILMMIAILLYTAEISWVTGFILVPYGHLLWQIITVSNADMGNSLYRFKSNRDYGALVMVYIIALLLLS